MSVDLNLMVENVTLDKNRTWKRASITVKPRRN